MVRRDPDEVDLLVVGGGKAGKSLAMDRAAAGWSVAMVERDKIGGTCINVACIPTKSLVGSARTLTDARHADLMGIELGGEPRVVLAALRRHKESVVGGMVQAHRQLFADSGMDFILGTARFVGPRTVEVAAEDGSTRRIRGRDVVINTGTTPALPPLPGIEDTEIWTSESILRLERLPERLLILGGGYIGCEFASMFALFGSRVTLVQGPDQLLPQEDPDIAAEITEILTRQGVEVRTAARATSVRRESDHGSVLLTLVDGSVLDGDELLVATGRVPVTTELELDATGVTVTDRGFVSVDDHLRTTAEHVWAAGDVAGGPQFTHASWNDFRILRANLTGQDVSTEGRLIPYTVFITPELARVGLTETQARAAGRNFRVAKIGVAAIPRAKTLHDKTGTWKAVVDADTDEILGASLLGHDAGEVIGTVQLAMIGRLPYQTIRDAALSHPTMSEGLNLLFDTLGSEPHRP
ncbi:Pyruvate/2-oxoglutarate dehydrogenase complex, dihydrolipoamide dehydrogenase (E3) component [Microlunatus soli]|uniref:Pyruvate/2-oxoglutarate dehydrogenase complex, dihydrolipoamide dehydrogenase (E3) component n=2 Tax=Microlunatus soli TaxID=630515 RepID=A0A1H1XF69_9ACTN|nr:Pyruvate/2-oxoglutarate dehydrogenase complex, dihydrolipoamide dehydrogenase (E3) component [Microlunatus soli]